MSLLLLLIDDEEDTCFLFEQQFRRWVRSEKVTLQAARSLTQGRELLTATAGQPRLVLCDINLPDGDGIELLRSLRARDRHTPVLMMTGTLDSVKQKQCLELGALDYLVKPLDFPGLMALITPYLET